MGKRPQTTWPALALAVALAAGLSACSGDRGPAALPVRCTGHRLPGPDTQETGQNDVTLPAAPAAVAGVPHVAAAAPVTGMPGVLDPADPHDGYDTSGWNVVREAATGGPARWSATIHPPGAAQTSEDADLSLEPYTGYVIARGGKQGRDIGAVSDQGTVGPVCALPPYDATDGKVALLPHAGLLIAANPASASTAGKDSWLNGYSTATGKRLWSADTHTSAADPPDLVVDGDTAYVWQEYTGKIAAYDSRTGHQLWLADSGTQALLDGGNRLLGAGDGRVYALADQDNSARVEALNSTTGKLSWKRDVPEPVLNNQISLSQVGTGLVAVAGSGRRDYLLDATDGTVVSSLPVQPGAGLPQLCTVNAEPAVAVVENGAVGVLSSDQADNRTIAIPPGKQVDVVVASTVAYVRTEQANAPVYGYNLATGQRVWTLPLPQSPAVASLYAFDGGFVLQMGATERTFS